MEDADASCSASLYVKERAKHYMMPTAGPETFAVRQIYH